MDPEKTLELLKEAVEMDDKWEALEHYTHLVEWLEIDGYSPTMDWDESSLKIFLRAVQLWLKAEGLSR